MSRSGFSLAQYYQWNYDLYQTIRCAYCDWNTYLRNCFGNLKLFFSTNNLDLFEKPKITQFNLDSAIGIVTRIRDNDRDNSRVVPTKMAPTKTSLQKIDSETVALHPQTHLDLYIVTH